MGKLKKLLGSRVREKRKEHGLSQQELAEKVGVSLNMIGYMERGEKFPSAETLEKTAKALGVQVEELFRIFPRDSANDEKKKAIEELENLILDSKPEYINMICNLVKEIEKGPKK